MSDPMSVIKQIGRDMLHAQACRTQQPAFDPGGTRRCSQCGTHVHARAQDGGWLRIEHVWPLDDQGRCPLCSWDS